MAAGALMIVEAGGTISDPYGNPFRVDGHDILASNGHLHTKMRDVLAMSKNGHGTGKPNAETEQLAERAAAEMPRDETTTEGS